MKKLLTYAAVVTAAISGGMHFDADKDKAEVTSDEMAKQKLDMGDVTINQGSIVDAEIVSMGSSLKIIVDAEPSLASKAIREAVREIRVLESTITSWKPSSEVYYLNDNAGKPIKVSDVTFNLVAKALEQSKVTKGTFDITVGAVWDLYPFRDQSKAPPSEDQITEALEFVGSDQIVLNEKSKTVTLPDGMRINLGAIGKGEAVNVALRVFEKHGISNAAISAGGDLTAIGTKGGEPWVVELENPRWEDKILLKLQLKDMSVATSGNAKRNFTYNGKLYGHIIDPRTGKDVTHVQSATVIAKDPTLADVYATAVFVLGLEQGLAWAESQPDVRAIIVDNNGMLHMTSNMKGYPYE
ncbi:FAD:protein FMN transferase [Vibrio coralliirubri]|uniref:FAD:protein FMN transferase n=1 Tax=Vibrio coralliirubri TaxID=1516159 RepID=UPI0022851021|nr:FAD:protein FMN transferase [Vibrio coralliirubri]MCY9864943.1 FAD:protein FMN transferase [Vibrio coralliirubri]